MSTSSDQTRTKVPVWRVVKDSYKSVFAHPKAFLKLSWIPALLTFVLYGTFFGTFFHTASANAPHIATGDPDTFVIQYRRYDVALLFLAPASVALTNVFAVRWYRFQLFGTETRDFRNAFDGAWRRFATYAMIVMAPDLLGLVLKILVEFGWMSGKGFAADAVSAALSIASTLIFIYAIGCSLVLPAAAYGRPMSWPQAWRALHGNFWRQVLCSFAAMLLAFITCLPAAFLVMMLPYAAFSGPAAAVIIEFVLIAIIASTLCDFYRRIVLASDPNGTRGIA